MWETASRGPDNRSHQASHPRGACEASSARGTGKQMPHQESGCPGRASLKDPLKILTQYKSARWKKDLDHIFESFFCYNYPSSGLEKWKKWKTRFFKYLGQHQEEWRAIKEKRPLLYYHRVTAKKGQLNKCLHLAGIDPPKGPLIPPQPDCSLSPQEGGGDLQNWSPYVGQRQ